MKIFIRNKPDLGFHSVDKYFFEKQDKKIRKLSNIGYRLLNFISYCHLFYSFCLDNITLEKFKKCLIKDCDILQIIQIDWNLLKEALQRNNVNSIQIFLNLIFKDLSKLMKEYKLAKNNIDRENFEVKVEELINQNINKYNEYYEKYMEENQKQSAIGINSLKTYVTELIHPSSDKYSEEQYPLFKYFNYTKYKNKDDMMKRIGDKNKYPLLRQLSENNQDIQNLDYLPAFNEFTNYMVNYYNFKISRKEAKDRSLEKEKIVNNEGFNKKFNGFVNAWEHIKLNVTKYQCRVDMDVKQGFKKSDKLINFLTDDMELYHGIYLAAACEYFIRLQNTFLKNIVDANAYNGILHNYVSNISKIIPIQEAKKKQILLIKESFQKSKNYNDFNDIIYSFSGRNIFEENGKINYSNYNSFEYDYDNMEEELGKIILPGVCLFDSEDKLNFMTYWGEGFRGGNSELISRFYLKYKQIDLNKDEKNIVIEYISNMNKEQIAQDNKNYDFKDFFGSIQMLLFYLTEKVVIKGEEIIVNIIKESPDYLKLSNDCKNFFENEGQNFTVNKMMNLFFFFEHLCFEDLAETLQPEYKAKIPEKTKELIIEKLLKNKILDDVITVKSLGAATRRLISRYLVGKIQITDINENRDLSQYLSKEEFWEEKIGKLENLMDLVIEKIYEFKLTVGQAYEFYNIIGEEDRNALNINNEENKIIIN